MVKKIVLTWFWIAAGAFSSAAQDTLLLQLPEAIDLGVSRSVDALVVKNEYLSSYWEYNNYRTEFLPEIILNGTLPQYSKSYNQYQNDQGEYSFVSNHYYKLNSGISIQQNIPWTGGLLSIQTSLQQLKQNGKPSSYNAIPFSITLEQPLSGYNRINWLKRIEPVKYHEATQLLVSEMEEVAHTTLQYYFDLLLGRVNLDIAHQNLENAEKLYLVAETKRQLGQISEAELLQMKGTLLNAQLSRIDALASFDARMFQLRSFLGLGEDVVIIPEVPPIYADSMPQLSYADVLVRARENNAFTFNIRRRMLEASRDLHAAKADRWNIQLFASFGYSGLQNSFSSAYQNSNWRDDQVVSVGIKIPIIDWGRRKSNVEISRANLNLVTSQVAKEELDFDQNIYLRVQNFNYQPLKVLLAQEANLLANQRYETIVEAFLLGKIEILNLNDSQHSKDVARRNYIEQLYLLWSYHYQIRSLTLYDYIYQKDLNQIYNL